MSKLEITAGKEFSADFTIVSSDGSTGLKLDPTDTAMFSLSISGQSPEQVLKDKALTIVDELNGVFNLTLTPDDTITLRQYVGFMEDRFPTIANYIGFIDFYLADGNRQATVDVFVKEVGIKDESE